MRHSHDEYEDPTHRHDHQITDIGKQKAIKIGDKLIEKYGLPDIIYCSPFKRTRQTMKYMLKNTPKEELKNIRVKYDNNLARYFSKKEQDDPSIFKDTGDVPTKETNKEFKARVDEHIQEIEENFLSETEVQLGDVIDVIWCITHTLILKRVAKYHKIELPKRLNFMENFILQEKAVEKNETKKCPNCGKRH
jgi:broad specificity phosphatase PhoE